MPTSRKMLLTSATLNDDRIPIADIAYERERLRNLVHELVVRSFLDVQKSDGITRSVLAKRLNKRPEQITRWFSGPGNWTLDTVSDLLLAMGKDPTTIVNDTSSTGGGGAKPHPIAGRFTAIDALTRLADAGKSITNKPSSSVLTARPKPAPSFGHLLPETKAGLVFDQHQTVEHKLARALACT